jgi:hypothetical protein
MKEASDSDFAFVLPALAAAGAARIAVAVTLLAPVSRETEA